MQTRCHLPLEFPRFGYTFRGVKRDRPTGKPAHLLGLGLDNRDGHKRVTRASQFSVVGGSAETHERMTETLIKTFEDIQRRGKTLEQTEVTELADIIGRHAGQ